MGYLTGCVRFTAPGPISTHSIFEVLHAKIFSLKQKN